MGKYVLTTKVCVFCADKIYVEVTLNAYFIMQIYRIFQTQIMYKDRQYGNTKQYPGNQSQPTEWDQ